MQTLKLTSDNIRDIVENNERVGMGTNGILFKYDDDTVFKFNYKDFIDCFPVVDRRVDLSTIGDITEAVKTRKAIEGIMYRGEDSLRVREVKSLISKQRWLKKNTMPRGLVYVDDYCVGYLLKYHKDMVNLYDYLQSHTLPYERGEQVASQITAAARELMDCAIYHDDFTTRNIMYNPQSGETEIIDFEDCVRSYDEINRGAEGSFMRQLNKTRDYLMTRVDTPTM